MIGWESIDAALTALGLRFGAPTLGQTTGGSHVANSEHYQGLARDYGTADSDAAAIAQALVPYATGPGAPIDELFFSPLGIFYKNGVAITPDPGLRQDHLNHVHVGVRPGVDLAADIGGGGATTGASLASFPGSGVIGDAASSLKKALFTAAFVAGGVGLVVLGGMAFTKRSSS